MTTVYWIVRRAYAKTSFDGEGAFRYGGRWSSPGTRVVYTSEHLSLAMMEYYVHIDMAIRPKDLMLVTAEIPDTVSRARVSPRRLPRSWRMSPAPPELAEVGDRFMARQKTAILIVPSAIAPSDHNWLINPAHPEFAKMRILKPEPLRYDQRFFKGGK